MADNKPVICTMTNEVFQPVRLYYTIHNKSALQVAFKKLRCMDYDPRGVRWTWLYDGEAKKLDFKVPYSDIPVEKRPIILGSFYSRIDGVMYLDVCSIERAVIAIQFFNKNVRRSVAEVSFCAIYNKLLTSMDDHPGYCFDDLFACVKTSEIQARVDKKFEQLIVALQTGQVQEALDGDRNFELVEAFPTLYYEDGIEQFEMTLQMRQAVAIKHWEGETDYRLIDLINQGVKDMYKDGAGV